jgi:hypothetical protein
LGYKLTLGNRQEQDPYDENRVFVAKGSVPGSNTNPLLKRYDIADRQQMMHVVNINYSPTDRTSYGVFYNFAYDDYDTSQLGLQFSRRNDVTFDWTYTPSDFTTFNVYYTYENIVTEQLNLESGAVNSTDPADGWIANHDNDAHTVGARASQQFSENRWRLSADYWYSDSVEEITFTTGANLTTSPVPKLKTRNHNAQFTGRYRWNPNMDISLSYLYQKFDIDDFATDGFSPGSDTIPQVLTLFGTLQDFEAHTVMAYFTYRIGTVKK